MPRGMSQWVSRAAYFAGGMMFMYVVSPLLLLVWPQQSPSRLDEAEPMDAKSIENGACVGLGRKAVCVSLTWLGGWQQRFHLMRWRRWRGLAMSICRKGALVNALSIEHRLNLTAM